MTFQTREQPIQAFSAWRLLLRNTGTNIQFPVCEALVTGAGCAALLLCSLIMKWHFGGPSLRSALRALKWVNNSFIKAFFVCLPAAGIVRYDGICSKDQLIICVRGPDEIDWRWCMGVWGAGLCGNQPDPQCKKKKRKKKLSMSDGLWIKTFGVRPQVKTPSAELASWLPGNALFLLLMQPDNPLPPKITDLRHD